AKAGWKNFSVKNNLQLRHGTEDVIPQRGRNAKGFGLIFIMVNGVDRPKDFQPVVGRFENMQNVMHAKVAGITNEESRQKCKNEVAEKKPEYKQEHCANGNAH